VPLSELRPRAEGVDLDAEVNALFRSYRHTRPADLRALLDRFTSIDLARKVVGIGSVGTRCWVMLLLGRDANDPLFLQIKEAEASALEPVLGAGRSAKHGGRVVEGQRNTATATSAMTKPSCSRLPMGRPPPSRGSSDRTPSPVVGWHGWPEDADQC
jgi:hypothetical protein